MKKLRYLLMAIAGVIFCACDTAIPMEENLYDEQVYLVGAKDRIIYRDLNIGYTTDTIYISAAVSGVLPTKTQVTVGVEDSPASVAEYNRKELGSDDILYQYLDRSIFSFPQENIIVKEGEIYGTYPIFIKPQTLHVDSLYMLAFKLNKTSAYNLVEEDTVVLVKLNLMNAYSGLYYMDGVIKSADNPKDSVIYKMPRNLQAIHDGQTVRMYHQKNEWTKGANDYRPDYCFNITVNADNSCTLLPWDKFKIISGGGRYYPEMKVFDLWYTFEEDGIIKKTRGFLYKERKNSEESRLLEDWIEQNRKYDH
jgi:hypothetical protein